MSQRLEFITMALKPGTNMTQLCNQYGITRRTGYKWLHRFAEKDIYGLENQSRRPYHSPSKTPYKMEQTVLDIRENHSCWGGRKIKRRLLERGIHLFRLHRPSQRYFAVITVWMKKKRLNIHHSNGLSMKSPINCGRWTLKGIFL